MSTFTCNLDNAISLLVTASRAKKAGVSAGEAVEILTDHGIEVPGDTHDMRTVNLRALLAWVNPAVGASKRGPGGGFCAVEFASAKEKKPQGAVSMVNLLKAQGVTDDQIKALLAQAAANPRPVAETLESLDG